MENVLAGRGLDVKTENLKGRYTTLSPALRRLKEGRV